MPRVIFCLYSRHDLLAQKKLQRWQRHFSRKGWATSILSHQHGPGFADEVRLGQPRWWPWLAWRCHGARCLSNEVAKQKDYQVFWCGFPESLRRRILKDPRMKLTHQRQKAAFGLRGFREARLPRILSAVKRNLGKTAVRLASPKLEAGAIYDLRCGGEKNPYHWLMHALVPLALCRWPSDFRVLLNPDPNPMQTGSLRMMGLGPEKILTQPPPEKVQTLPAASVEAADAVRILRKIFGNRPTRSSWPKSTYVSRKDAHYRRLLDEARLRTLPPDIRPGWVVMSDKTWEEQLEIFQTSRLVCGVHGAAFVFIVFSPPGSTLIEMFPGGYERNHFRHLAEICGMRWERLDCEPIGRQGRRCREADLMLGEQGLQHLQACLESSA